MNSKEDAVPQLLASEEARELASEIDFDGLMHRRIQLRQNGFRLSIVTQILASHFENSWKKSLDKLQGFPFAQLGDASKPDSTVRALGITAFGIRILITVGEKHSPHGLAGFHYQGFLANGAPCAGAQDLPEFFYSEFAKQESSPDALFARFEALQIAKSTTRKPLDPDTGNSQKRI